MIEDLLFIAKNILIQINVLDLTEDEKDYIVNVVRKVIFMLLIELHKIKSFDAGE